jgi:hypothetical protein
MMKHTSKTRSAIACLLSTIVWSIWLGSTNLAANDLYLNITMVRGEHSRDSNSTSTSLTLNRDTLVYEESYHGAHSGGRTPVKKEYKLTSEEQAELTKLLHEKNLLVTRTLSALSQEQGVRRYFELKIHSKLNGTEHTITINGPRDAAKLKRDGIYQNSILLIAQLFRIINRSDPDLSMPDLIN